MQVSVGSKLLTLKMEYAVCERIVGRGDQDLSHARLRSANAPLTALAVLDPYFPHNARPLRRK
jgi:hypothetical protein